LESARFDLEESLGHYAAGREEEADRSILRAVLEGVGPVEPRLNAAEPRTLMELERTLAAVRTAMAADKPVEEVRLLLPPALQALQMAVLALLEQAPSPWSTFTLVLGVILRAGWVAFLLVAVLLGILRATGRSQGAGWIHGGWLAAVGVGLLAWPVLDRLPGFNSLDRTLLEGAVATLTSVILLYSGLRLRPRTGTGDRNFLEKGNPWTLAPIPFLAAFLELPKTVLFLRGVGAEGGKGWEFSLGAGIVAAFSFFFLFAWTLRPLIANLPIHRMFGASSGVLTALALVLGGKAAHAFQQAGLFPATPSFLSVRWDPLGLYPTLEAQAAQAALLALGVFLWLLGKRPA
jgi:high-affinity iron transporter